MVASNLPFLFFAFDLTTRCTDQFACSLLKCSLGSFVSGRVSRLQMAGCQSGLQLSRLPEAEDTERSFCSSVLSLRSLAPDMLCPFSSIAVEREVLDPRARQDLLALQTVLQIVHARWPVPPELSQTQQYGSETFHCDCAQGDRRRHALEPGEHVLGQRRAHHRGAPFQALLRARLFQAHRHVCHRLYCSLALSKTESSYPLIQ